MKGAILLKKTILKNLEKALFYFVPVILTFIIIFLEIWGVSGIWKLLWIVAVLFLGCFLLYKGKAFGCVFGILFGIWMAVSGIMEVPSRVNMGNAGPRIVPDFEDYWWQIWHTDITWGIAFSLFFLALGIYVFVKNRKNSRAES